MSMSPFRFIRPLRGVAGMIAATALAVAGSLASPAYAGQPPRLDTAEVTAFLDQLVPAELERDHLAGAAVAVVQGDQIIAARGYGYADTDRATPVSADSTLFRIGSNTKTVVGTAVMQLVEQGRLDLHTDVNQYLTAFKIPEAFGRPVTLEHLLTHTAGFEELVKDLFVTRERDMTPLATYLAENMPARVYPPGTITAYSNYGLALAGYLVELASGQPLGDYLRQHIFEPLGMQHTTYAQPVPEQLAPMVSFGHRWTGSGFRTLPFEYVNGAPAGSISASVTDMGRFLLAHLNDGRLGDAPIIGPATAADMHRRHFANDSRSPAGWGLAFMRTEVNGVPVVGHAGATLNFFSTMLMLPQQGIGIAVATNTVGGDELPWEVVRRFIGHFYAQQSAPAPAPAPADADASARADGYVGYYAPTRRNHSTVEKILWLFNVPRVTKNDDGSLSVSALDRAGQPPRRWVEIADGEYRDVDGADVIVFADRAGTMTMFYPLPTAGLQRLPWYSSPVVQLPALLIPPLMFLVTLIGLAVAGLWRLMRRRRRTHPGPGSSGVLPRWLLVTVCLLNPVFIAGLATLAIGDPIAGFANRSPTLLAVLGVGVAASLGDIVLALAVLRAWWRRAGALAGRIWLGLLAGAGVVFVAAAAQWNLLGWQL